SGPNLFKMAHEQCEIHATIPPGLILLRRGPGGVFDGAARKRTKKTVSSLQIGPVTLKGRLVLASMEEHTDLPFRLLAKEFGASLVITEMGQPDRIAKGEKMALRMLATQPAEHPVSGQVLGGEIEETVEAAKVMASKGFDLVD